MALTKPQRRTNFFDYFPLAKKLRLRPSDDDDHVQINQFPKNYTRFEDLPAELFLEIFQYLDMPDIHKGFFNLNTYLQNILFDSTFLWQINISLMSKSNFEQLNRQLLIPNRHRIQTLNISNPFFVDSIFSPVKIVTHFEQLETLIFNNVKPKYFPNILRHLSVLRNLSKLIIISESYQDYIYETVFSLPKLKYFKIKVPSFSSSIDNFNIPFGKQIASSIEHIVMDVGIHLTAFISLSSYTSNLQTLYIRSLLKSSYNNPLDEHKMEHWNHLKKIEIDDIKIDFNQFETISKQLLSQIEILRLGTYDKGGIYLNARRWEQLISSSMPKLRVFDIQFQVQLNNVNDENPHDTYKTILDDFSSLFWIRRKWFFDYQFYKYGYNSYKAMFYSMNSKRRECVLYKESTKISGKKYAEHIEIRDENVMLSCSHYFSRATQITLSDKFDKSAEHLPTILKSIIPVRQLTSLTIEGECNFSMQQVIYLLNIMPNINILEFNWNFRAINNLTEIRQSQVFKNVAKNNNISHLIINTDSFEIMKTFILLCPQIKHLTIEGMTSAQYKENIQFLISNKQAMLSKLCLLHLKFAYYRRMTHDFETLVNTSDVFRDCSHKTLGNSFYICL